MGRGLLLQIYNQTTRPISGSTEFSPWWDSNRGDHETKASKENKQTDIDEDILISLRESLWESEHPGGEGGGEGGWEGTRGEEGGKVRILWQDFWQKTGIGFTHGQESFSRSCGKDNGSSAGKDKAKMDGRREAELYFEGIKPLKINRHLYLQLPSVPETVKEQRWKYNTKQWYREIVPRET